MFTSYGELATPSEEERRLQVELSREDVNAAVALRTKIVRVTAGSWPKDCGREEALSNVADCLKRSLDYAQDKGVMLALEDHPEIGTSLEDFTRILSLVNDDRLKVNLDTSNPMESGETAVPLAKIVKERVVHVHASDRNRELEHQVVGEGCVPFAEIFKILKSVDYDGWISLESGGTKGREGIAAGMRYIKEVWESI
jgi:sugar phosphate isomerase/epimerase